MLYFYGLKLGFKSLCRGKINIELLTCPVRYWRFIEYKCVFNELKPVNTDRILDIGSPKLLSLYLAEKIGCEIYTVDIDDYFLEDFLFFQKKFNFSNKKIHAIVQDGRKLGFQDKQFTKVYAISVVEHIPGDGDTECLKEIARVLVPKGKCVITVPFSPVSRIDFKKENFYWSKFSIKDPTTGEIFFQRRYSENDLYKRLARPSGLRIVKINYIGEKIMIENKKELCDYLHPVTGPIQPIFSRLFHSGPTNNWKELQKPLCAVIVLEKS